MESVIQVNRDQGQSSAGKRLRITFVLPYAGLSGGVRVVAIYAGMLRELGHTVVVVSIPRGKTTFRDKLRSLLRGWGWPQDEAAGPSHLDGTGVDHRCIDRARPIIDSDVPDADVVIATWWETAEWVQRLSGRKGAQVYFLQHDETVFYSPVDWLARERVLATLRAPMHKIAVARWIAEVSRERGLLDRIAVVPNAVDHAVFDAPPRQKQERPAVGMVYSPVTFKGCDVGFAAYELAKEECPDLRLVCLSAEEPSPKLPLPQGAEVHVRPEQGRIPAVYSSCDAWLFTSRSEGFGLPILEAMACRTPVIGTPAGPAPDLLGGGAGVLVRPDDPADMAAAILRVVRMPNEEWRGLSDAAWGRAAEFDWAKSARQFEAELRLAVDRRLAGSAVPARAGVVSGAA